MQRNLDELDQGIKKYGGNVSSDRFEFKKGNNKIRVLTFPEIMATHFLGMGGKTAIVCTGIEEGCPYHGENAPKDDKGKEKSPSLKMVCYIIDREDGKVKLAELPLSMRYALKDLQNSEGFEFADFPMPYDINVISDPDNSDPKAKYRAVGIPKMIELTVEEEKQLTDALSRITPEEYIEKRKMRAKEKRGEISNPSLQSLDDPKYEPAKYPTADSEGIDTSKSGF